jgi:hypothetical protein
MTGWRTWAAPAVALVLLNASLTFENTWPTLGIQPGFALSVELCICVVALAAITRWLAVPSPGAIRAMAIAWLILVFGRYVQVTAPALYGREVNLYWDSRFIPDVVGMVTRVAPVWLIVLSAAAFVLALVLLYLPLQWACRQLTTTMAAPRRRKALVLAVVALTLVAAGQDLSARAPHLLPFSTPVTQTAVRQIQLVAEALARTRTLPPSPAMHSDLAALRGADVFVVFVEAYGAVSDDQRKIADALVPARTQLEADIRDTHRAVVSAYVESPTFGGSSWLAHLSLLTGVEVRDADTNARLMAERRETVLNTFQRRGYRTVALMPGLRQSWPEGRFYGFDEIYGAAQLEYRGPEFGWFAIPDQFSLSRLDALEHARQFQSPLFVFFPTISTHFPFLPTPPYQPDWTRLGRDDPFDTAALVEAYSEQPDWTDFGPGYVRALSYDFAALGGYLRQHAGRDVVMILIGDHQPASAVTGEGASWDVPIHVIATRGALLDRLVERGFHPGLAAARPTLGAMHTLLPVLLDAFDGHP